MGPLVHWSNGSLRININSDECCVLRLRRQKDEGMRTFSRTSSDWGARPEAGLLSIGFNPSCPAPTTSSSRIGRWSGGGEFQKVSRCPKHFHMTQFPPHWLRRRSVSVCPSTSVYRSTSWVHRSSLFRLNTLGIFRPQANLGEKIRHKTMEGWKNKPILSVEQFDPESLRQIIGVAHSMKKMQSEQGSCDLLKGKILANVFYEASTRTSCSFQAAMLRLGGAVIQVNESSSSVKKGESLEDTIRSMECYADVIVLRHPVKGSACIAAKTASIPVLNAGDGVGEHPTQALLDLFTICDELKISLDELNGHTITLVGDLKNGRTVHSLSRLLRLFKVKLNYVAPESLKMPQEIIESNNKADIEQHESSDLLDFIDSSDIIYVTRIQKERFDSIEEYEAVKNSFCLTPEILSRTKANARVLHPLPRVNEISTECDADPKAAYFRQMKNGMYVRMALLALVLGYA